MSRCPGVWLDVSSSKVYRSMGWRICCCPALSNTRSSRRLTSEEGRYSPLAYMSHQVNGHRPPPSAISKKDTPAVKYLANRRFLVSMQASVSHRLLTLAWPPSLSIQLGGCLLWGPVPAQVLLPAPAGPLQRRLRCLHRRQVRWQHRCPRSRGRQALRRLGSALLRD